jgi:hypothetical protein
MGYDSNSWSKDKTGFGKGVTREVTVRTEWSTPDIWLRKEFEELERSTKRSLLVLSKGLKMNLFIIK